MADNTDLASSGTQAAQTPPPEGSVARAGEAARRPTPLQIGCLAVVIGSLGYAYAPNILDLYRTWMREPDYSHGILVLPIALFILYRLWPSDPVDAPRVWLPGIVLVLVALLLRGWLHSHGKTWSETFTLLLVVFGIGLSGLGLRTMWRVWPAFAFLVFWFPLPNEVNSTLSQPLQSIATRASTQVLRFTGLWVMPEGNVIMVGKEKLEVAAACNGLSMLMSLAATVVAAVSLIPMTILKRLFLLGSIIPIALVSNILRISATAWCYHQYGAEIGSKYAHDWAGYLMMPTAMGLVLLELWLMSWLIIEARVKTAPASFGTVYAPFGKPALGETRS